MDSNLSFSEFVDYFREHLSDDWQEDRKIDIRKVKKNNGTILTGICLPREGCLITPTFYLEAFYDQYLNGTDLAAILIEFRLRYEEAEKSVEGIDPDRMMSYPAVKDKIIFRIVHYEKNKELLEDCPYVKLHDLAVTFRCLVSLDPRTMSSALISNDQMEDWGVSMEELMVAAESNTCRLFPPKISPLHHFLQNLDDDIDTEECGVFIATNRQMINGATVMLYSGFLEEFAEIIDEGFYILPSSVHELLFIPESLVLDEDHLRDMVRSVNDSVVEADEILSYSIYYYNKKEGKLICR